MRRSPARSRRRPHGLPDLLCAGIERQLEPSLQLDLIDVPAHVGVPRSCGIVASVATAVVDDPLHEIQTENHRPDNPEQPEISTHSEVPNTYVAGPTTAERPVVA
jgi:hypothetical protein